MHNCTLYQVLLYFLWNAILGIDYGYRLGTRQSAYNWFHGRSICLTNVSGLVLSKTCVQRKNVITQRIVTNHTRGSYEISRSKPSLLASNHTAVVFMFSTAPLEWLDDLSNHLIILYKLIMLRHVRITRPLISQSSGMGGTSEAILIIDIYQRIYSVRDRCCL